MLLGDEHGPVAVYGIPYLDPDAVAEPWGLREPVPRGGAHRGDAPGPRRPRAAAGGTRSVVLAHAFVAGAQPSDSERDITVGGVSLVPTSVFDGVDYVALGHLHGRHMLTDRVRYSGSPLAYSFSEADHRKGSWLVDLDAGGWVDGRVRRGAGPAAARPAARHPRRRCSPTRRSRAHEGSWVEATLTDQRPSARRRWTGCGAASRTRSCWASQRPRRARRAAPAAPPTVVATTTWPASSWSSCAGEPDADELALLDAAVDACCDDPEADTLVGSG